ncbi:MAG TPA: DUF4097 family beta strand repeat-containing protein [Fimbriimonadaceae bacterium]|nr:DUF4097 family beta strand repeat-containing protein [Fimbriimonadaceae bacterium]
MQEGKLSADDAYDLIEAFEGSGEEEAGKTATATETPPPAPEGEPPGEAAGSPKDPFKGLIDAIEKLTKSAASGVDWKEVASKARESAAAARDTIKEQIESVRKGGGFSFLCGFESKEVSLPLSVDNGKLLRIENPCGDITITGGHDAGNVTAHARFRGTGEDTKAKAEAYTLVIEENDSSVLIKQPDVTGLSVDLEIQLAGTPSIEIRSESGDVQVSDTRSGCRVATKSGDVRLKGLNGQIEISAQSGDLTVEDSTASSVQMDNKSGDIVLRRLTGSANVRTTSGDIAIRDCEMKTLAVDGVSGDVDVDLRTPISGAVSIRTVSGNTLLAVPDGCDTRVALKTLRGSVTCSIPLEDEVKAEGQVTGRIGDGKGTLDVSAVTGDIVVEMHASG